LVEIKLSASSDIKRFIETIRGKEEEHCAGQTLAAPIHSAKRGVDL